MALDPALRAVIAKINKTHGQGSVMLGSEIPIPLIEHITTGSLSFDAALGGGWAQNHFNEIIGNESAGKTLVALKTIAANQALDPSWMTVWFASEDFNKPYARMMGVDLSRVILREEVLMELVYSEIIEFLETREVDCIVLDSLPALEPMREADNTMEDFQPGLGAFLTGKFFRMSNPVIKRPLTGAGRSVTGLVINQWREKIGGYGNPRTTPGGRAKNFFYYQRVEVRRDAWIDNTRGNHIGQAIKMTNEKNKLAPPGRVGLVDAYFADGGGFVAGDYDTTKDIVSAAIAYGVIDRGEKRGQWVFGQHSWPNRPRLDDAVSEDAKLRTAIKRAVLKANDVSVSEPTTAKKTVRGRT
jgi:recombination protein RecA